MAQLVAEFGPDVGRLCDACVAGLPGVGGAGMALMTTLPAQQIRYASDAVSAEVEDLQVVLGEGPCREAFDGRRPVLVEDLDDQLWSNRWPVFAPAAVSAGARALFALPLQVGAICLGVIDLYRPGPGRLAGDDLAEALAFADAATELLLAEQLPGGPGSGADPHAHRAVVHQATGMISAQLQVPVQAAFLRLRAQAYVTERNLDDVAADVVARRLRFTETDNDDDLH
ncbi:GAF domain-containing protein [Actinoplanes ianthinogenes]|uniref:GAF domain-containing protein n=1 Tax=Actinoplanes ianthinogenes TaxID=122358 RepID=A0ABM7M5X2_9ACTN|nr:GAF and ANTAR domain-containing protein [Actinoplanes ianthinogenes]BCJ46999.1 GAF domain-containing protein [Actinoplanes ianthinogenes]GGR14053.1 GAF domain-containing protein [Actinoplanes ianthinogenes]